MKTRKPLGNTVPILVSLLCVGAFTAPAMGAITDINGFIVQRDSDANDPGGTNQQAYPLSNLVVTNNGLASLRIREDSYDNEPAHPGFSANRTNAWFTSNGTDRFGLTKADPFEAWTTINLDTSNFGRINRKEAGFRFQRPDDPAANSLFIVTADSATGGQVAAFGTSGAFFPLIVFDEIDPVHGVYVPGTDARLGIKYQPAGVNIITDPATYEFIFDAGADGLDMVTSGPQNATNFAGFLDGTHLGLEIQNHVADGNPGAFGDATTFANEFLDVTFFNTVLIDPLAGITGDFNASGQVEQGDLDLVLQNWGDDTAVTGIPVGWTNDNDQLGQIEQTELDRVLQNWGSTSAPDFQGSSVPEPAALAGVLLGLVAMGGRAIRQR